MIRKWFGALSGKKSEENLSPPDFRDLYLAYLKQSAPEISWEIKDELEITVTLGDTGSHSVFLDNAYHQYLADPGSRDETLELYISSFLEVIAQKEAPVDPRRIVPVIKDRGWLEEIQAGLEERDDDAKPLPEYLSDPYNSELAIFFAEDSPRNIRYLTVDAFAELNPALDRETLLDFAVSNLKQLLPEIEITGGDGIYLITARSLSRIVLGFSLLGHAAVLSLLTAGGPAGGAPLADATPAAESANPLPQALALTAIVISFGLTLFLLALARRQNVLTGDDLVEDDVEDRRIARGEAEPRSAATGGDTR